jgi:hypothetical protein
MGIVIQAVLEDLYNQHLWKHHHGLQDRLTQLTREKLSATCAKSYIDWHQAPSYEEMEAVCVSGVLGYLRTMKSHRLLGQYARSEVDLFGHVASWLPVGGRADFVIRREDTGITLLDGKNSETKMKYVDPDQLRWYALCFALSYHRLPQRLGFVWYRYPFDEEVGEQGLDWIDFTKRDLAELIERAKKVRRGQEAERFDARPAYKVCRFCDYESVCPERQQAKAENAARRKRENPELYVSGDDPTGIVEFGFGGDSAGSDKGY